MKADIRLRLVGALLGLMATAATAHAADLSGKWSSGKDGQSVFTFDQHGDQFTGQVLYQGKTFKIIDGTIDGDAISFFVLHDAPDDPEVEENGGKPFRNTAKGTVSGDEMTFSGSRENTDIRRYTVTLHRFSAE